MESEIDEAWGKCIYDICDEPTTIKEYHIRFGNFVFVFQWFSMFCHVHLVVRKILDFAPGLGQSDMKHHHVVQDVPYLLDVVQYRCCAIAKRFVDFHRFSGEQMRVF